MAKVYSSLREASENVLNLKGLASSTTSLNEFVDDEGETAEHRKVPTDFSFSTAKTFDQINERMPPWTDAERQKRLANKADQMIQQHMENDKQPIETIPRDSSAHTPILIIPKDEEGGKILNGIDKYVLS